MLCCGQAGRLGAFQNFANSLTRRLGGNATIRFRCPCYPQPVDSAVPMWIGCVRHAGGICMQCR